MKNTILLIVFTLISVVTFGQRVERDSVRSPQAREKIRAAHAAYITERLQLTSSEAEKFWPVYREYGQKRRQLRDTLREARKSGVDEKRLLDLDLKIKQQELDLEKEYAHRFEGIISADKVAKLQQAEADFRKLLLRQIQERQHRRR
jgi:hypothetical protein